MDLTSKNNENSYALKFNYLALIASLVLYQVVASGGMLAITLIAQFGTIVAGSVLFSFQRAVMSIYNKNKIEFYTKYMPSDGFQSFRSSIYENYIKIFDYNSENKRNNNGGNSSLNKKTKNKKLNKYYKFIYNTCDD